jgi:protein involved in polysaccharide export with SLBB domain
MVAGHVLKSGGQMLHHDLATVLAALAVAAGAVAAV